MNHLKNSALITSLAEGVILVGTSIYFYIQINKLHTQLEDIKNRLDSSESRTDKYHNLFVGLRKKQRTYDQLVQTVRDLNMTVGIQKQTIHTLYGMMDHYSRCFHQIEEELKKKDIAINLPPLPNMNFNNMQGQGYNSNPYGGMPPQQSYGGMPPQQSYGGMPPQQSYGGMPPQQPYGGMPSQQPYGGMPPQQPYGGMPPQQLYGGMPSPQQLYGGMPSQQPYGGMSAQVNNDDVDDDDLGL